MHAEPQVGLKLTQALERRQWQAFGLVAVCLGAPLLILLPTLLDMVRIWNRSETFTHGWFVFPAFLYFVWQRRKRLAALPVRPFLPALVLVAGLGLTWLLGELSSSLTPSFFALVAFVPAVVLAVLGWSWVRELLFPLAFLFFAVPFGEVFVPMLMEWTADFTVLALQFSGVPVLREGQHLMIPSGRWSVVEACSGIRYLIASMFVGALYAWMMYRSPVRRAAFFAASIAVPIVANWLRAYMIIMLGHLSDNRIATGVDHLIYGWIFFGIVMVLLFWIGSLWREDHAQRSGHSEQQDVAALAPHSAQTWRRTSGAAAVTLLAVAAFPVAAVAMMAPRGDSDVLRAAIIPTAGWESVQPAAIAWKPHLENASSEQRFAFAKNGAIVEVYLGIFRDQRQGAELVNSMNQLVPTRDLVQWLMVSSGSREIASRDKRFVVRTAAVKGQFAHLVAWQWYWLGGLSTSSDARAKLDLAIDRLLGRDDTSAWVTLFVIDPPSNDAADQLLQTFVAEMEPALNSALHGVAGE